MRRVERGLSMLREMQIFDSTRIEERVSGLSRAPLKPKPLLPYNISYSKRTHTPPTPLVWKYGTGRRCKPVLFRFFCNMCQHTTTTAPTTIHIPPAHRKSAAVIEYAGPALSSSTHDSVTEGWLPGSWPPPQRLCIVTLPPKNSAQMTWTVLSSRSKSTTFENNGRIHKEKDWWRGVRGKGGGGG